MDQYKRIKPDEPLPACQDFERLKTEGIQHAQQYAQKTWTDYNHHDPGVTILEYLCFGLTDLGFRADFPITDLLYAPENQQLAIENNAFYAAENILPCAAINTIDYRRLILDHIKDIYNVWVTPVADVQKEYPGLFDIQLQIKNENSGNSNPEKIKKEVFDLWMKNRNLCEDIRSIHILQEEPIEFQFNIQLHQDASAEQVLALVTHELEHFLNPKIQIFTFEEKLAQGEDINILLEGPKPSRGGYIDPNTLQEAATPIYKTQVQDMLSKLPGIKNISAFKVIRDGFVFMQEEIAFPSNSFLVLSPSHKDWGWSESAPHPIQFFRNNPEIALYPDPILTEQNYKTLIIKDFQHLSSTLNFNPTRLLRSDKNLAEIAAYYSIQRLFPAVYGLGHFGLSKETNLVRQAQARQLKGYLAIFETLFSSYLKQLSEIKHLYNIDLFTKEETLYSDQIGRLLESNLEKNKFNYAFEFPVDIPDVSGLINQIQSGNLARGEDIPALFLRRCNTFLDHLLARFGESFQSDWVFKFLHSPSDLAEVKYKQLLSKYFILQEYEQLSLERGRGFNYREQPSLKIPTAEPALEWPGNNVSGLKKRLSYWLNIHDYSDRSLTQFFPFSDFELKQEEVKENTDSIPLELLLEVGHSKDQYIVSTGQGDQFEVFFYDLKGTAYGPLFKSYNESSAENWRINFAHSIKSFNERSRGFFIVEHILLRPLHQRLRKMQLTINSDTKNVFQSLHYATPAYLENITNELITIVSDPSNVRILQEKDDDYFVLIVQDEKPILITKSDAGTLKEEDAKALRDNIVTEFRKVLYAAPQMEARSESQTNFTQVNQWIENDGEQESPIQKSALEKHFYVHKISIVLPNWPSFFKEASFQALFHELVLQHIPAHLQAQMLWLDWDEMQSFEKAYQEWWTIKKDPMAPFHEVDEKSAMLLKILLDSDKPWPSQDRELLLSKERFDLIYRGDNKYLILESTDLQIIEGIDAKTEYFLATGNIKDWNTLSNTAENELIKILLKEGGLTKDIQTIQHWQKQARAAASRNWAALKELQGQLEGEYVLDLFTARKVKFLFRF